MFNRCDADMRIREYRRLLSRSFDENADAFGTLHSTVNGGVSISLRSHAASKAPSDRELVAFGILRSLACGFQTPRHSRAARELELKHWTTSACSPTRL